MFDLVVPVYNAIHHVRSCLLSIQRHGTLPYHLYVVDDASAPYTAERTRALVEGFGSTATYLRNDQNLGYLRSVNYGARQGSAPYVVFINSDTLVTPRFLEKTKDAIESDPAIAVVSAVSNWANWTRICWKMPPGHNIYSIPRRLEQLPGPGCHDIQNASGFYFAATRSMFEELNGFDEVYGKGYWEEADYCMRVLARGGRVVVDDTLFIYHHGWGSFEEAGRDENMDENRRIFMSRWEDEYTRLLKAWKKKNPIPYMEPAVLKKERSYPAVLDQRLLTSSIDAQSKSYPITKREAKKQLRALLEGDADALARATHSDSQAASPRVGEHLKVLYVLPAIKVYGGIISVLQVVNQLILQGMDANAVTYGEVDEAVYRLFPTFFSAFTFASQEEMVSEFPDCDVIVATSWDSVYPASVVARHRPGVHLAYFVQDYEPDFYAGVHPELYRCAERTYSIIPDKIVKTRWLGTKIKRFRGRVHRIPLGLNLDYYYDREEVRSPQILALGRPQSKRRNFDMVVSVFSEIHRIRPNVTLALYGFGYTSDQLPFPCKDYGKLTQMREVAKALNESTILLDCSTFQGFGRPGLEAMACGTFPILTHEGGITQYAKHEYNCLLIDPTNREEIVAAVTDVLADPAKYRRHLENAKSTAEQYSLYKEGERTARLLTAVADGKVTDDTDFMYWDQHLAQT